MDATHTVFTSDTPETVTVTPRPPTTKLLTRRCPECGTKHLASAKHGRFCSREHRNAFNNRRMTRGLAIYDLLMACRYQRGLAKRMKLWGLLCKILVTFREEDQQERDGRASWLHPNDVVPRYHHLYAETIISSRNYERPKPVSEEHVP